MTRSRGEGGASTVLALGFAGLLLFVGLALAGVGALVVDHRRAQAAADLAALAGAADAGGCGAAARIASDNDAELVDCARDGPDVVVRVSVTSHPWAGWSVAVTARARAGPA